jgi:hypothetical protein
MAHPSMSPESILHVVFNNRLFLSSDKFAYVMRVGGWHRSVHKGPHLSFWLCTATRCWNFTNIQFIPKNSSYGWPAHACCTAIALVLTCQLHSYIVGLSVTENPWGQLGPQFMP